MTPAKRGDLVAIVRTERITYVDRPSETHERVELARVTSVTREGIVKRAEIPAWSDGHVSTYVSTRDTSARVLVVGGVDVDGVLAAYASRRYVGAPHSTMVPPLDSLDDARALLSPFRRLS
jgi:hypothetical protein